MIYNQRCSSCKQRRMHFPRFFFLFAIRFPSFSFWTFCPMLFTEIPPAAFWYYAKRTRNIWILRSHKKYSGQMKITLCARLLMFHKIMMKHRYYIIFCSLRDTLSGIIFIVYNPARWNIVCLKVLGTIKKILHFHREIMFLYSSYVIR